MAQKDKEIAQQHAHYWELVRREADYMARVCAGIYPGDAEMQTELMQQATTDLLPVLQRWQQAHGSLPMPQGYFHRTWQNLCKRHYNSLRAYQLRHCPLPPQMEAPEAESLSRFQQLYDIVDHLSNDDRALVELYFRSPDMSAVGRELGINPKHASVKLYRVVQKMKRIKKQLFDD